MNEKSCKYSAIICPEDERCTLRSTSHADRVIRWIWLKLMQLQDWSSRCWKTAVQTWFLLFRVIFIQSLSVLAWHKKDVWWTQSGFGWGQHLTGLVISICTCDSWILLVCGGWMSPSCVNSVRWRSRRVPEEFFGARSSWSAAESKANWSVLLLGIFLYNQRAFLWQILDVEPFGDINPTRHCVLSDLFRAAWTWKQLESQSQTKIHFSTLLWCHHVMNC